MPYKIDEVNGYLGLLHCIVAFAAGWPERGSITESKAGNALLKYVLPVVSSAPLETWTIVCTTAGGDGVAVFSVTGSTSGAQASATAGVHYDNGIVTFKITGPALYNAQLGDQYQFTFAQGAMAAGSVAWNIDRYVNQYTSTAEVIMHGIGSGSEEIYIGLKALEDNPLDIHNLVCNGFTGYNSGQIWEEQPGAIPYYGYGAAASAYYQPPSIAFADSPIEGRLYLAGNSRRIQGCLFFESYSAPFYLGYFLPFMTPSSWAYPLMIGGGMGGKDNGANPMRYSDPDYGNSAWFAPLCVDYNAVEQVYGSGSLKILNPGLSWEGIANYRNLIGADNAAIAITGGTYPGFTWPYAQRHFEMVLTNIDGSYLLMPIYIFGPHTDNGGECVGAQCYGVPEGCFAITGSNNNQENTFTYNGDLYVVVRSASYTEVDDYMAMRLDT